MAETEQEPHDIAKFSDHEVIVPPNRLKKAMRHASADDLDPLVAAERALERLSGEFENWMNDECQRLDEARQVVRAEGFSDKARQVLFRAAHDIKGHAATFGFPMAAEVADSLCRVIDQMTDLSQVPLSFVDQCVDAVRAIIREHRNFNAEKTAEELAKELRVLAADLLRLHGGAAADAEAEATGADQVPPLAPT